MRGVQAYRIAKPPARPSHRSLLRVKPVIQLTLAGHKPLPRHCPQPLDLGLAMARPERSIVREPRREECTICAATASEEVVTVRL